MTTKPHTITNSQFEFIKNIRKDPSFLKHKKNYPDGLMVPFCILNTLAKGAGYSAVPVWCMARKVTRGIYMVPELFADDSDFIVMEVRRGRKPGRKNGKAKSAKVNMNVEETVPSPPPMPATNISMADSVSLVSGIDSVVDLARAVTNGEGESFTPTVDDNYIPWGYHNEIKSIIKSRRFCPIFITGLSGNGKTVMVEQVCASMKRECIRVNFTTATDEDDMMGGFRLIGGETRFVPGPVLVAMERGAVLLLDEIDLGGHLIMCLQSVLEGKGKFIPKIGKYVRPAPGFTVIATANTKGKGSDDGRFAGTNILNEAFLDRFAFTYEQDYAEPKIEKRILSKFADSVGVDDDSFLDALIAWADIIRKSFKEQVVSEIITTRRLRDIVFAYSVFGNKMTAIERCVSRFDETTKDSFLQFYTKVDAEAMAQQQAAATDGPATDAATTTANDPNNCPF